MTGRPSPDTLPARPRFSWRDFFRRAGWLESVGIVGVPVVTVVAVLAPWITPFDPQLRVAGAYLPPSAGHWFGTDEIGRDLFSRVILGVQYTWLPGLAVIGFSLTLGSLVGLISGLAGGKVDLVIERIVDLFLVLPSTVIALAVVASLGPG
ncbi:MAG: ABC transporter permease, partial [Mesorhizobium sp.]